MNIFIFFLKAELFFLTSSQENKSVYASAFILFMIYTLITVRVFFFIKSLNFKDTVPTSKWRCILIFLQNSFENLKPAMQLLIKIIDNHHPHKNSEFNSAGFNGIQDRWPLCGSDSHFASPTRFEDA